MEFTPEQKEAITTQAPLVCVVAGAGSGKTRVLIERILFLLDQGRAGLDEIAAITFTEKAAGEMKARLRDAFRIRSCTGEAESMARWREWERRVDGMHIDTIHAFCGRILRENALFLGIDPEFGMLADAESTLLMADTVRRQLHELFDGEDAAAMRLAVQWPAWRIEGMVTQAVRAFGQIRRLQQAGYPLDDPEALCLRWREDALRARDEALDALGASPDLRSFLKALRTFDGQCDSPETDGREIRRRNMIEGMEALMNGAKGKAARDALDKALSTPKERGGKKNWHPESRMEDLAKLDKKVRDFLGKYLPPEETDENLERQAAQLTCDLAAVASRVHKALQESKARTAGMEFDDLIERSLEAVRMPALRDRVAKGIKHLLIDEFQDTDRVQLAMARALAEADPGPDLFIVGDAKQSIYYFRGAEVSVFQREQDRADALIRLSRNFRSLPGVLDFVNHFFEQSRLLSAVEDYQWLQAHRPAVGRPCVEILLPPATGEPAPRASRADNNGHGADQDDSPNAEELRRDEGMRIAARIQAMCTQGAPAIVAEDDAFRTPCYGDIALLLRAFSSVRWYEDGLRRRGVPYSITSGRGFHDRPEVRDVLNMAKLVLDPWNEPALLAYLRGPYAGLTDDALVRMRAAGGVAAAFHQPDFPPPGFAEAEVLEHARALLSGCRARRHAPLHDLLHGIVSETGHEAILLDQFMGLQKASNVRKLLDLAHDFARRSPPTLSGFVAYLDDVGAQAVREPEAVLQPEGKGAVSILTVHKSKGLEFPIVFLPDMQRGLQGSRGDNLVMHREYGMGLKLPGEKGSRVPTIVGAMENRIKQEEEDDGARLLYVAMTRAKDYLVLSPCGESRRASWRDALNMVWDLDALKDGQVLEGPTWSAAVQRTPDVPAPVSFTPSKSPAPGKDALLRQIAPAGTAPSESTGLSVSALLDVLAGGHDEDEERPRAEEQAGPAYFREDAMARGTAIHRMFELWDFARGELPCLDAIARGAGLGVERSRRLSLALQDAAARFKNTDLYKKMRADNHLQREVPFLLRVGNRTIGGAIDALLGDGSIIDYKTGTWHEERHARYEWQIHLYAWAVHQLLGIVPPVGYLCYVDEGTVREVPIAPQDLKNVESRTKEVLKELDLAAAAT